MFVILVWLGGKPMDIDAYAERNLSVAARKKLATILQQELYIILQVVSC